MFTGTDPAAVELEVPVDSLVNLADRICLYRFSFSS